LKRANQTLIQNPLAIKLLSGEVLSGQTINVSAENKELIFKTENAKIASS
jgi:ATP-dependent Clp protease ATP-binding subunit ClpB